MRTVSSVFRREGDYWTVAFRGRTFRLRDSKGLRYLDQLLTNPGKEIHALDLAAASDGLPAGVRRPSGSRRAAKEDGLATGSADAGEVLDATARAAYRNRLKDLGAEREEAERFNDPERAARAAEEIDTIEKELASAFGLGGRARRTGSQAERARVNVRNSISAALKALSKHDPALAEHLSLTIRTGTYCSYSGGEEWGRGDDPRSHDLKPGAQPAERFLATVLFTDVVGSTEKAATLGDRRWKEVLDQHDVLTIAEIERCDGRVVKSVGDSFFATFASPAKGIRCALAVSKALEPLGLQIRAGVHTGECEPRGDDVGGIAVHIGARILSLAEPGEALVSSTVRDLVTGSGLRLEDRGFHALRGVPGTWRLFSVALAGRVRARENASSSRTFSIMLVDDHPMWRETLRKVVEHACPATVVAEASDGAEAVEMARVARPDVVVMDLSLPKKSGPEATRVILAELPETKVLMLSSSDERGDVLEAIKAGASGYVVKTSGSADIADAVRRVHSGELVLPPHLTGVVLSELRSLSAPPPKPIRKR